MQFRNLSFWVCMVVGCLNGTMALRAVQFDQIPRGNLVFLPHSSTDGGESPSFIILNPQERILFSSEGVRFFQRDSKFGIDLKFLDRNPEGVMGIEEAASALVNRYSPETWSEGLVAGDSIRYRELYPGVDLVYSGSGGTLKRTFFLQAGVDPKSIRMRYEGATSVRILDGGDLQVATQEAAWKESAPISFQIIQGRKIAVESSFSMTPEGEVTFSVSDYDSKYPLVIDPEYGFISLIGGGEDDVAFQVDWAESGLFMVGVTRSSDFPVVPSDRSAYAGDSDPEGAGDIVVLKMNPETQEVLFATFLGGSETDFGNGIRVDDDGRIWVTGWTRSPDFPILDGVQTELNGPSDGIIVELDADGTLLFSTYLGGSGEDQFSAMEMYRTPGAFFRDLSLAIVGFSNSSDFPFPENNSTRADVTCACNNGATDALIIRFKADRTVHWATFLGGSSSDVALGVDVAPNGNIFVTGYTESSNFPKGLFETYKGGKDGFIAEYGRDDARQESIALFGGSGDEQGLDVAWFNNTTVLAVGSTSSMDFRTSNALQDTFGGGDSDGFITRLDPEKSGSQLREGTYWGGDGADQIRTIISDGKGSIFLGGNTSSGNLSLLDANQSELAGGATDAFLASFSVQVAPFNFLMTLEQTLGDYLGGAGEDGITALAVEPGDSEAPRIAFVGASNSSALARAGEARPSGRLERMLPGSPKLDQFLSGILGTSAPRLNYAIRVLSQFTESQVVEGQEKLNLVTVFSLEAMLPAGQDPSAQPPATLVINHSSSKNSIQFSKGASLIQCLDPNPTTTECQIPFSVITQNSPVLLVTVRDEVDVARVVLVSGTVMGDGDPTTGSDNSASQSTDLSKRVDVGIEWVSQVLKTVVSPVDSLPKAVLETDLRVFNKGPGDASNVVVDIRHPEGVAFVLLSPTVILGGEGRQIICSTIDPFLKNYSCSIDLLEAGAEVVIRYTVILEEVGGEPQAMTSEAMVSVPEDLMDDTPFNNELSQRFEFEGMASADLKIEGISIDPILVRVNDLTVGGIVAKFRVMNIGDDAALGAKVFFAGDSITLVEAVRVLGNIPIPCEGLTTSNPSCVLGDLGIGESFEIQVTFTLSDPTRFQSISAVLGFDGVDKNLLNNVTSLEPVRSPDISVRILGQTLVTKSTPDGLRDVARTEVEVSNIGFTKASNVDLMIDRRTILIVLSLTLQPLNVEFQPANLIASCLTGVDGSSICSLGDLEPFGRVVVSFEDIILTSGVTRFVASVDPLADGERSVENNMDSKETDFEGARLADSAITEIDRISYTPGKQNFADGMLFNAIKVTNHGVEKSENNFLTYSFEGVVEKEARWGRGGDIQSVMNKVIPLGTIDPGASVVVALSHVVTLEVPDPWLLKQSFKFIANITSDMDVDTSNNLGEKELVIQPVLTHQGFQLYQDGSTQVLAEGDRLSFTAPSSEVGTVWFHSQNIRPNVVETKLDPNGTEGVLSVWGSAFHRGAVDFGTVGDGVDPSFFVDIPNAAFTGASGEVVIPYTLEDLEQEQILLESFLGPYFFSTRLDAQDYTFASGEHPRSVEGFSLRLLQNGIRPDSELGTIEGSFLLAEVPLTSEGINRLDLPPLSTVEVKAMKFWNGDSTLSVFGSATVTETDGVISILFSGSEPGGVKEYFDSSPFHRQGLTGFNDEPQTNRLVVAYTEETDEANGEETVLEVAVQPKEEGGGGGSVGSRRLHAAGGAVTYEIRGNFAGSLTSDSVRVAVYRLGARQAEWIQGVGDVLAEVISDKSPLVNISEMALERFDGEGYGFVLQFNSDLQFSDGATIVSGEEVRLYPVPAVMEELNLLTVTITGTGKGSFSIPRILPEPPVLMISREGDGIILMWEGDWRLESAERVEGPWTEVMGAESVFEVGTAEGIRFYRLRRD